MKKRTPLMLASLLGFCAFAQRAADPELKLRILVDKDNYSLREKVTVRAELTNLTSKTLCFPVPDQDCSTPEIGWIVTEGEAVRTGEGERFICHADGGGAIGAELDSNIKNSWIKLPPNGVYVTNPTDAQVTLSEVGDWKLRASYHPPEGSFSAKYKTLLQTAARKAGCELPDSTVAAQPRFINVRPDDTKNR